MSRFTLVTLALVALVALTAVAPIAAAQPQKFTRPLTVVVWRGSLIEAYLNYTELADQYGFGPKGYQFALGVPGTSTPVTTLPILISDPEGKTFCTVGHIIIDIGSGNYRYALWMSSSTPYYFRAKLNNDKLYHTYKIYLGTDEYYHLYNVSANAEIGALNLYGKVYFPDKGSLEAAIEAANGGTVPPTCQPLLDLCAGGCWLPVYGLVVPEDAPLTSGNKYSLLIKTTAVTTWQFEGGLYVLAADPAETKILVKYDAGKNNTIAFGRKEDQIITLADGSKLYVTGKVNVTINWTEVRKWLEDALGSITGLNVSVAVRLVYRPSVYSLGETLAETGMIYDGTARNFSIANSLLTYAPAGSLPARVYGGQFGAFNVSDSTGAYFIKFNLTVNPYAYLPIVNKWLPVKYGNDEYLMPGACGSVDVIVRVNETIKVVSTVTFDTLGLAGYTQDVPFWAIALYLPLGYKLTVLPSTIYADDARLNDDTDFVTAFNPKIYGDKNVLNAYDEVDFVVLNFIHASLTKFYIDTEKYTVYGAGSAKTVARNVTELEPLIVLCCEGTVTAKALVNSSDLIAVGNILNGEPFVSVATLLPAPYGGKMYYLVPVFKANLTTEDGTKVISRVMALLPPVNVTTIPDTQVMSGDVDMKDGTTIFRVRPVVFAWAVDTLSTIYGGLVPDTTNPEKVTTGTYLMVYGVGFDLTDNSLALWIGNISIPLDKLDELNYPILRGDLAKVVYTFDENGTIAVLVPLWRLYELGYDPLAGATSGLIYINVTGTGENRDVASGSGLTGGVFAVRTGQAYDYAQYYEITVPDYKTPIVLLEPRPVVYLAGVTYLLTNNFTLGINLPDVWVRTALAGSTDTRYKTPTRAYEILTKYNPAVEGVPRYFNVTHMMVVLITKPATVDTTYALVVTTTANEVLAFLYNMTKANLVKGVYVARDLPVPRLEGGQVYRIQFYNESYGGLVTGTEAAQFEMKPSVVFYSVETRSVDMSTTAWIPYYPASITAMPNGTIKMFGFAWAAAQPIDVIIDNTPKATITADQVNESGEWTYEYTVPATAAGSTITIELYQGALGESVQAYVRVFEIKRRGLVLSIATGPVMYEDGSAKVPVILTATYYDIPVRCVDNPRIEINVYDQNGVPVAKLTEGDLKCLADGVWMGTIQLKNVETPFYGVIVARMTYEIRGVASLVQYATTGITIDPEIKTGIMNAADLASQAAQAANEAKKVAEDVKDVLGDVNAKLDTITGKLTDIAAKVSDVASTVSEIKMSLDDMKKSMSSFAAELGSKLDEISSDVKAIKTAIATLPDQITSAVKAAVAGLPTKDDIKSMIDDAKAAILDAINAATGKVTDEVKKAAADVKSAIDAAAADIKTAISQSTDRICGRLDKIEAAIKDLSGKVATKDDVEAVKSELAKLGDEVAAKVKETLDKAVSDIKATVQDAVKSINDVKGKVEEMSGKLGDIDSKVSNLSTNTMLFGAGTLIVSIIVLALLILVAVKSGLLASH